MFELAHIFQKVDQKQTEGITMAPSTRQTSNSTGGSSSSSNPLDRVVQGGITKSKRTTATRQTARAQTTLTEGTTAESTTTE
jgi:hypothetical protein